MIVSRIAYNNSLIIFQVKMLRAYLPVALLAAMAAAQGWEGPGSPLFTSQAETWTTTDVWYQIVQDKNVVSTMQQASMTFQFPETEW